MSSKANSSLFDLIQSMTKSEKRYFKLMSSRHTIGDENNYVRLFDAIEKQTEYNEEALFDLFEGEAFLNRFSITKKRLSDHILSSLNSFHLTSSIEAQIYGQLQSADILFEKSLYDQCRKVLRSAEKLAQKYELSAILMQISYKQKRLLETNGYLKVGDQELNEIEVKDKEQIEAISRYHNLWLIKSRLFAELTKRGVARSEEETKVYSEICSEILHDFNLSGASEKSTYLFHHIMSAYYYAIGDLSKSLSHLRVNLEGESGEQSIRLGEENKYVSALTNAIYISDKIGEYKESIKYLAKLKKFASEVEKNEDLSIKLFSSINSIELSLFLRRGDFKNAIELAPEISAKLDELQDKISPVRRAFLAFKIAVSFMGEGDYSSALKWINLILNDSRLDKTEDIFAFTQLIDLLVHIELNNDKLLPYSFKNTQRYFKTRNRMYSFEKVLLQGMNRLIKCDNSFDREQVWEVLHDELSKITNDNIFESVALDYFDFQSWAEAKLKRKSFDQVIREKYNKSIRAAS